MAFSKRRFCLGASLCVVVMLTGLIAGAGCPVGGDVLNETYDIPAGGVKTTPTFHLEDGVLYSFRLEGNSNTDPDADLVTSAGSTVANFRDTGGIEFHEMTVPSGDYLLHIANAQNTSMTVKVQVSRSQ